MTYSLNIKKLKEKIVTRESKRSRTEDKKLRLVLKAIIFDSFLRSGQLAGFCSILLIYFGDSEEAHAHDETLDDLETCKCNTNAV